MINALRGMKDLMFEDAGRYEYIVETASRLAKNYGFEYIETPILEETPLFMRSVGESSDIVGKEMYRFRDKGDNDVCMRPEGTAGVVRAFIQAKLDRQQGRKYRFFYFGPMFRYERPQKGRLRQFHQFGVESFGESAPEEDFTLISLLADIFDELGIRYRIAVNSLGCGECMPRYRKDIEERLRSVSDSLCEDCVRRIDTNPIRVFDCKNEKCASTLKDLPRIGDSLCEKCEENFSKVRSLLETTGMDYFVDRDLVRGLDYYSGTAFEFISDEIGAQSSIAGGGRYDRLIGYLGGRETPGVGFALGMERIMELVEPPREERKGIYMGVMVREALERSLALASEARKIGRVVTEYEPKGLKAHLKGADRAGARYAAIIGEDELNRGEIWVRDLSQKSEESIPFDSFVDRLLR
jgi:histidyl-tRNA synthetase